MSESWAHESIDEKVHTGVEGHETMRDWSEAHGPVGHSVTIMFNALKDKSKHQFKIFNNQFYKNIDF